jgi:parvulin-like peptidyl-prolyl isomerase
MERRMPLVINGETVDDTVLDREFQQVKQQVEMSGTVQCCERDEEFRALARENIVSRVLLAQEARRRHPAPPAEDVDKALQTLIEHYGGKERFLYRFGLGEGDMPLVRRDVQTDQWVRRFMDHLYAQAPEPSENDLRRFHRDHADQYMTPERIRAFHIIKRPQSPEQRELCYAQLRDIRHRLLDGADFVQVAQAESDRVHELEDGEGEAPGQGTRHDLGLFHRGELMEELEFVAFSLRVGEISSIFPTPYGFHLLKCVERIEPEPIAYEQSAGKVREDYLQHRREEILRALIDRLKAGADIQQDLPAPTPSGHSH